MTSVFTRPNTLYFSDRCKWCQKFRNTLVENAMEDSFQFVDVLSRSSPVPPSVTTVPTIIIDNVKLYQGQQAFAWLDQEIKKAVTNYEFMSSTQDLEFSMVGASETEAFGNRQDIFTFIQDAENPVMHGQAGSSVDSNKSGGKNMDGTIERLMQQRASEIPGPVHRSG